MQISNFTNLRAGSTFPASLDIQPIGSHESYGVMAVAWTYRSKGETGFCQVRKHSTQHLVALLTFRYDDQELPEFWKDSVVLWDSRHPVTQSVAEAVA